MLSSFLHPKVKGNQTRNLVPAKRFPDPGLNASNTMGSCAERSDLGVVVGFYFGSPKAVFFFSFSLCGYGNPPYSVANGRLINLIHFGFPLGVLSAIRQIRGPAVYGTLLRF